MQAPFADPLLGLEYPGASLPLVGRDQEMQIGHILLQTVAHDLLTGARAMTISGEMGVGKTRLLAHICTEARGLGFRVLKASAYEANSLYPYFPFIEALRPLLRTVTRAQLCRYLEVAGHITQKEQEMSNETTALAGAPLVTALARLFPELPTRLQVKPTAEILSPDQEKFRSLEAVATLLEQVALEQPLLVCIDNLQWADSLSLELTLFLTVRLRKSRVALVGATRPPRPSTQFSLTAPATPAITRAATKALGDFMRHGMLILLPLSPLDKEDVVCHLQALLPGTISEQVIEKLLGRAEGNPFFLEELVRTLTLNHYLVLEQGEWREEQDIKAILPDSLVLAVEQRLEGLSEECHELLRIASLFGRIFPRDILIRVVEENGGRHARRFLDEALQASVIARLQGSSHAYTFCQGIVQEALWAELSASQMRTLHGTIGRVLEESYAHEAAAHAVELARHYAQSGEKKATLRWSLLAGEEAARHQAYREAIGYFLQVLRLVEEGQDEEIDVVRLYLTIGELWMNLGELEQAANVFQLTLQHAAYTFSPLVRAHLNRSLADVYRMQARYDQALSHLQAARSALDENKSMGEIIQQTAYLPGRSFTARTTTATLERIHTAERILLLQAQATLDILLNHAKEAEAALWQSHQLAIEMGDRGSQAFALHLIGWLRGWGEQIHEAIRLQEQANQLYTSLGDPFRAAMGDQSLGIIYQALGEIERARLYTLRGFERARRYGVQRVLGWLYWNYSNIALVQGDWTSCESYLQQAMQEALANEDARLRPLVMQTQCELHMRRGNWHEAEIGFQEAIQVANNTEWFPSTLALYGHFLAVTGRRGAARTYLDRAANYPEPAGFAGHFYIPFLAEGYHHLEASEQAASYLERIRSMRNFMYYGSSVDRILGIIATTTGEWQTAEQAFAEGLRLCQRANNRPEEAAILYEQARAALIRDDSVQRISELCDQARTLFLQYNMQRAVDLVDILQEGAEQLQRQDQEKAHIQHINSGHVLHVQLTKRELSVLRLVAEGHTDREVADTLVISPRTANRHLSNIFVKLDVPGRAAAVAYAIRHGLV